MPGSTNVYNVKSVTNTLQGEGRRAGCRSVFVRFAGCNLWNGKAEDREKGKGACARWCDTDFFKGESVTAEQLEVQMDSCWTLKSDERWCVLTGGEPLLQLDKDLLDLLHRRGWKVALETNGTMDPLTEVADPETGVIGKRRLLEYVDWVTVSPKLGSDNKLLKGHELKVVLPGALPPDPGWTDEVLEELAARGEFLQKYVQPQDPIDDKTVTESYLTVLGGSRMDLAGQFRIHIQRAILFVNTHPDWKLSLQVHKFAGLP